MNFFEHQDRARRQSKWLIGLFVLAVLAIVFAIDLLVLFTVGPDPVALLWATVITGGIILGASGVRSLQLRGGGGEVALAMGGTLVEPEPSDPLRRRLRNVVEEMAIASGVPVPEIYVLEHERGINAFAAGYSPADAAVAVTRGTLEHLDRDELQGVIAHEFSHILNGDMRLNIRLIGFVFGILVLGILGRKLLYSARYARDSRNAAPAVMIGLVVIVVGYIGLFFGRWIKAAVSRQREYLADASAVQFTRNPDGIGRALKKIGALPAGSYMLADSEEVGHMLFGTGMGYQMFATHPPLEKRILAIDPSFDPAELESLARTMDRHAQARRAEAEEAQRHARALEASEREGPGGFALDPSRMIEQIGQPGIEQVFAAAVLTSALPSVLKRSAHSDEWAMEAVCSVLLDPTDGEVRERQLLAIAKALGSESEARVRTLYQAGSGLERSLKLPLLEMAFPQIRRRPESDLIGFVALIDELIEADGRIAIFEYTLSRLLRALVREALRPSSTRGHGRKRIGDRRTEVTELMAILAHHGHPDDERAALEAFGAGMQALGGSVPKMPVIESWPERLDGTLARLDALRPASRHTLVLALLACIVHDGKVEPDELDLLRVICALLHIPLPLTD